MGFLAAVTSSMRATGMRAFEIGADFVRIQYDRGGIYRYSEFAVGAAYFREMKRLALKGSYLNAFINQHPEIREAGVRESV